MHTQIIILGADSTGLLLSHLLYQQGIDHVIVDTRSCAQITSGMQAGLLQNHTLERLQAYGLRLDFTKSVRAYTGVDFLQPGKSCHIDALGLTGQTLTPYLPGELAKLLMSLRTGEQKIIFEASDITLVAIESEHPVLRYRCGGVVQQLTADFIIGCDGLQGVSRAAMVEIPSHAFSRSFPFQFCSILLQAPPVSRHLVYSRHPQGFAMAGPAFAGYQHFYLQADAHDENLGASLWSDARIFEALHQRLHHADIAIQEGFIVQKTMQRVQSFEALPMRSGRLFLVGEAGRCLPPILDKNLDMAVSDIDILCAGLMDFYRYKNTEKLDRYGATASRRTLCAKYFSIWMTEVFCKFPESTLFEENFRQEQLAYIANSRAASVVVAENIMGCA